MLLQVLTISADDSVSSVTDSDTYTDDTSSTQVPYDQDPYRDYPGPGNTYSQPPPDQGYIPPNYPPAQAYNVPAPPAAYAPPPPAAPYNEYRASANPYDNGPPVVSHPGSLEGGTELPLGTTIVVHKANKSLTDTLSEEGEKNVHFNIPPQEEALIDSESEPTIYTLPSSREHSPLRSSGRHHESSRRRERDLEDDYDDDDITPPTSARRTRDRSPDNLRDLVSNGIQMLKDQYSDRKRRN